MKNVILSDAAFELLERIQFCMAIPYCSRKHSLSKSLELFVSEVCRLAPDDSILRVDMLVSNWKDYVK